MVRCARHSHGHGDTGMAMKLVFPQDEHPPAILAPGDNVIGLTADGAVAVNRPELVDPHFTLHLAHAGVVLRLAPARVVRVNGKEIGDLIALRDGDLIEFAQVQARLVAMHAARGVAGAATGRVDDDGFTRVRAALPKLLLRGVSGAAFGKLYPVTGPAVIGRAPECDIAIAADEISRRHAQLRPTTDGLLVEDLESSNGTWINDTRVQRGLLRPGDELRLDTVRFLLVAPGLPAATPPRRTATAAGAATPSAARVLLWVMGIAALLALLVYFGYPMLP